MKYKTYGTTGNHKLFIRKRETLFEYKDGLSSSFKKFDDHKEMKTWEFAAFQKEQFAKKKEERRRFFIILMISIITAFILFFLTPIIMQSLYDAGYVKHWDF